MEKITIDNKEYLIDDGTNFLDAGTEGAVYELDESKCFKKLNIKSINDNNKVQKILTLCDKSNFFIGLSGFNNIGIPLDAAYSKEGFCGFSMPFFKDCHTVSEIYIDLFSQQYTFSKLSDLKVIEIIKQLFFYLQLLHSQKIILADLNSNNILWNPKTNQTYIIDIDSAQVGQYTSGVCMDEYLCPTVKKSGKNSDGSYIYSTDSDIYALSILCFELLTGTHPFNIGLNPILSSYECMEKKINYMSFHHSNTYKIKDFRIANRQEYEMIKKRLDVLKKSHKDIYDHFLNVFHYGKRPYYNRKTVKPVKKIHSKREIKAIRSHQNSEKSNDPIELQLFLNNYRLNLSEIC